MESTLLEVIVCSIEDAIEAEAGGANRLEVVCRLDVGGLTPSLDLVRRITAEVSLPLRVMVRENVGFEVSDEDEKQRLCDAARALDEIGVDGLVLGFLQNGRLDSQTISEVLACASNVKATFHHAFEAADDKESLITELKQFPQIDRILAHGGNGPWEQKTKRLAHYKKLATPQIGILIGGGLDSSLIEMLSERHSFNEFHVGGAAREDGVVKRSRVSDLVKSLS
jgi:copper homeostasis protein